MFESRTIHSPGKAIIVIALGSLLIGGGLGSGVAKLAISVRCSESDRGVYGGDLNFLRRCHTGPRVRGESNHYIDLWSPGSLPVLARVNGLTNNHALFVDSHGQARCSRRGCGYGFYPSEELLEPGQKAPYFSSGDLATVLGPETAATIHNILLAGCNDEGRIRSEEIRRYFVNATNVTYMAPGELAFKPMFYQAIVLPSRDIKQLYGKIRKARGGQVECVIADGPVRGAKPLGAYVADLYCPGARTPYRTQRAGRELLEPPGLLPAKLRADISPAKP